jgi:hypothetical protein
MDDLKNDVIDALKRRRVSRNELQKYFHFRHDRAARQYVADIAKEYPVTSVSNKKGYKMAVDICDYDDAKHTIFELESRIKELQKRTKPLQKFCKEIEKSRCI